MCGGESPEEGGRGRLQPSWRQSDARLLGHARTPACVAVRTACEGSCRCCRSELLVADQPWALRTELIVLGRLCTRTCCLLRRAVLGVPVLASACAPFSAQSPGTRSLRQSLQLSPEHRTHEPGRPAGACKATAKRNAALYPEGAGWAASVRGTPSGWEAVRAPGGLQLLPPKRCSAVAG